MSEPIELMKRRPPSPEVVTMLERWLEMARAGEVTSVAICGVKSGRRLEMSHVLGERGLEQMALAGALHECARDIGGQR